jgi:hypothetical protein
MPLFASDFGGRHGPALGCLMLVLVPTLGLAWFALQIKSLLSADRLSWFSSAFVLVYSYIPGYIVAAVLRSHYLLAGLDRPAAIVSACGLLLLPCTITREVLKYLRDRPPPAHRRRPRR